LTIFLPELENAALMKIFRWLVPLLFALPLLAQDFDVLIKNGRVVDGSGNPWTYADVGIKGDKITLVGRTAPGASAKRTIDAAGLIVAPGFIDLLDQSEMNLLVDKQAVSKLTQGITTGITGEGGSIAPQNEMTIEDMKDWLDHFKINVDWRDLDGYFKRLEKQGSGINLGTYVGAAQVREVVVGRDNKAATPEQIRQMQNLVETAMRQGALGVSTSLIYAPGNYASTEELIALAQAAGKHGGIYASHIRNENTEEMEALAEAFRIGREGKVPVHIFHLKVAGKPNWGNMPKVIAAIEEERRKGLEVTANQYPYFASSTSLGASIPPKYHDGGTDAFIARLKDAKTRTEIRKDLESPLKGGENMWHGAGGADGILVASVLSPSLKQYEGKRISEVARMQNKDPLDALLDLVVADRDNVGAIYFSMSEDDVRLAMKQPWVAVGCDNPAISPTGPLAEGKAHPRGFGSFPRILGRYVRDQQVLRLEDAIRKFTSLPAQIVRLQNRGLLKEGYFADLTIFNPQTVTDIATFEDPNRTSRGIEYVFVNGVLSVEHDKVTGQVGGRPLRGNGYIRSTK
jgi:dihydroorotase/N-acyl-D-amino-acid deacylase